MCGIVGFVDYRARMNKSILTEMTDSMYHRGPDGSGYQVWNQQKCNVGLGHRRLSIIDLSEHNSQPMQYKHLHIVFNGEIYNYQEIKSELAELGHSFQTSGDTEVILAAYDEWGSKCVDRFIGMFAIALFDMDKHQLVLIRDRAGVKPLYYYHHDGLFLFASELKAFHKVPNLQLDINKKALALYMQLGYIPTPYCIFDHCQKLDQGSIMVMDLEQNEISKHCYWSIYNTYKNKTSNIKIEEAIERLDGLLTSAFQYRMVADVPVGVFLSGGYDSSIVTGILQHNTSQRIKTYTIGFEDEKYNEALHASAVANYLDTDHTSYICTEHEAKEIVSELPYYYDEPFGDTSAIPTILVSRLAKQDVTVALSADGGDEIFAGYKKYKSLLSHISKVNKIPRRLKPIASTLLKTDKTSLLGRSARMRSKMSQYLKDSSPQNILNIYSMRIDNSERNGLLRGIDLNSLQSILYEKSLDHKSSTLSQLLATDYHSYMCDDILTKVDRAGMSCSLEGREPLLDHRIVEFAATLPDEYKIQNGQLKYILKMITHRYIPQEIMDRPKMGFGIPVLEWLKNDLSHMIDIYLDEERLAKQGIFDSKMVKEAVLRFRNAKVLSDFEWLWFLISFQMWYEKWITNK